MSAGQIDHHQGFAWTHWIIGNLGNQGDILTRLPAGNQLPSIRDRKKLDRLFHRNDASRPAAVAQVWKEKFNSRRGPQSGNQSNVDLAVLDSTGKVVHCFGGFSPRNTGRRDALANFAAREISG